MLSGTRLASSPQERGPASGLVPWLRPGLSLALTWTVARFPSRDAKTQSRFPCPNQAGLRPRARGDLHAILTRDGESVSVPRVPPSLAPPSPSIQTCSATWALGRVARVVDLIHTMQARVLPHWFVPHWAVCMFPSALVFSQNRHKCLVDIRADHITAGPGQAPTERTLCVSSV